MRLKCHVFSAPEVLEQRIAPAGLVTFLDVDGDTVTIETTKGTSAELEAVVSGGAGLPISKIDLAANPVFQGTSLTVSASQAGGGDGHVNVGFINAVGLDLKNVTINGDLGRIIAGDSVAATPGVRTLTVESIGKFGPGIQGPGGTLESIVTGPIKLLEVHGVVKDASLTVVGPTLATGSAGKIGELKIGSVEGGAAANSGSINVTGAIGKLAVDGDLLGGNGAGSGSITSGGNIGAITVGGKVQGGELATAVNSGRIFSGGVITSITVSEIRGGLANSSGQITSTENIGKVAVEGGLVGGGGFESGTIGSGGTLGAVEVGLLQGGTGERSGAILSTRAMQSVEVAGSITGGGGKLSGVIASDLAVGKVTIGIDVIGGLGEQSGAIGAHGTLGAVLVKGNLVGSTGPKSGQIVSDISIKSVAINGSVTGSVGVESGAIGSLGVLGPVKVLGGMTGGGGDRSGIIASEKMITSVFVEGTVQGGSGNSSGAVNSGGNIGKVEVGALHGANGQNSGEILASGDVSIVLIHGSLSGGSVFSAGLVQGRKIGTVTIEGAITGGDDYFSGAVYGVEGLGKVTVEHDVQGGGGSFSGTIGSVNVVVGALKEQVVTHDLGPVTIHGSLLGGLGFGSGQVMSSGRISSVAVDHGIVGGAADSSGSIFAEGDIGPITSVSGGISGDLGGDRAPGNSAGRIFSRGNIASITLAGDVVGGDGTYGNSTEGGSEVGQIYASGKIGPIAIKGGIAGGEGAFSAQIRGASISKVTVGAGMIGAGGVGSAALVSTVDDIGLVNVANALQSGVGPGSGSITAARSLLGVTLGSAVGNDQVRVLISAEDTIKAVTIHNFINRADILAGYTITGFGTNPDAQIGKVLVGTGDGNGDGGASGSWTATNLIAGVSSGDDGRFGTFDDFPISTDGQTSKLTSKIASVIIKGSINPSQTRLASFGIEAELIASASVAGESLDLKSGPRNDFFELTSPNETRLNELVPLG